MKELVLTILPRAALCLIADTTSGYMGELCMERTIENILFFFNSHFQYCLLPESVYRSQCAHNMSIQRFLDLTFPQITFQETECLLFVFFFSFDCYLTLSSFTPSVILIFFTIFFILTDRLHGYTTKSSMMTA